MQVKNINNNSFSGFYNNKLLLKTLEYASDNGALFSAATALTLSSVIRPLSILTAPKAEKENKQYACAKSIASSLIGVGVMYGVSAPIVDGIKNIQDNPQKFLKTSTINFLKNNDKNLQNSSRFIFSTQMFKLSSAFLSAVPKAFLTCALIAPIMHLIFNTKNETPTSKQALTFKGNLKHSLYSTFTEQIATGIGKVLDAPVFQHFTNKFKNTNFPQHMFNINDILATGLFAGYTLKNKDIKDMRKKTLIANASIMTGLSVLGGYCINALLKKPTEIFIKKLKEANLNSPKIEKYITGAKIVKPALILGGVYYILAPVIATTLADIITNNKR